MAEREELTLAAVARRMGTSVSTLRRWMKERRFRWRKPGKRIVIHPDDAAAMINEGWQGEAFKAGGQ